MVTPPPIQPVSKPDVRLNRVKEGITKDKKEDEGRKEKSSFIKDRRREE